MPHKKTHPRKHPPKHADQSLKETAESVVVAFILAFIFRAYIVEAFVIPTGSMAPTLLGQHVRAQCDQCDYAFKADGGSADSNGDVDLRCPMCFNPIAVNSRPGGHAGDRILVQKYLYRFADPHRFDVAVFKNPEDPAVNFIKRIVGLPDEKLMILDGNVYTQPQSHTDWRIARKTDPAVNPRWEKIQRDVFQPVYHSRFVPADQGTGPQRRGAHWQTPWQTQGPGWNITNDTGDAAFSWKPQNAPDNPDKKTDELGNKKQNTNEQQAENQSEKTTGQLRFDFSPLPDYRSRYAADFALYPYNQPGGSGLLRTPLEDLRLAATVTPQAPGVSLTLTSTARIDGPPVQISARFNTDGRVELTAGPNDTTLQQTTLPPFLQPDQATSLELWVVDQSFLIWVDGQVVLRHHLDLPYHQLLERPGLPDARAQNIRITLQGAPATLTDLELDRDLFYGDGGTAYNYRAGLPRSANGRVSPKHDRAVTLEPNHFFMAGDNAPHSEDSRKWGTVNPYVARHYFNNRAGPEIFGRVPRDLLMGRAFLVYYPAPQPLTQNGRNILPNFREIRFIH